jgi:hypothetical protein
MSDSSVDSVDPVEHALLREAWLAEGRLNAFSFAVRRHADLSAIRAELEAEETSVHAMLANAAFGSNNPMTPGASPRIYRDGYVSGLRAAIELIEKLTVSG